MTWRFRSRNSKYQTTSDRGGGRCKQEMMESFREDVGLRLRVGTKAPLTSANKIDFFFLFSGFPSVAAQKHELLCCKGSM